MPNEETIVTTAQTNGDVTEPAGNAAAGEQIPATEPLTEQDFTDGGAGGAVTDTEAALEAVKQRNAENARRRREAERQKELKSARESAIIEALGGKNPYTGGEIKDSADVEEFLAMRDIEKKGGDPVSDFAKFHKQKQRDAAEAEKAKADDDAYVQSDLAAFRKAYPDVDIKELLEDERFIDYADGKIEKKVPLSKIYEGYSKLVGDTTKSAKTAAERAAAQALANHNSSAGSAKGSSVAADTPFTREQVMAMSQAEVEKNYDKIMRDMKSWTKS